MKKNLQNAEQQGPRLHCSVPRGWLRQAFCFLFSFCDKFFLCWTNLQKNIHSLVYMYIIYVYIYVYIDYMFLLRPRPSPYSSPSPLHHHYKRLRSSLPRTLGQTVLCWGRPGVGRHSGNTRHGPTNRLSLFCLVVRSVDVETFKGAEWTGTGSTDRGTRNANNE